MKHILIGTITLEKDVEMYNNQFQYAASFETLNVSKGEYPVYAREDGIVKTRDGSTEVRDAYVGFEGTVVEGNIGGKKGDHSTYHQMWYGYSTAERFLEGHDYSEGFCRGVRREWALRPEWDIKIHDVTSCFDGKRFFTLSVTLKDGAEFTYMD